MYIYYPVNQLFQVYEHFTAFTFIDAHLRVVQRELRPTLSTPRRILQPLRPLTIDRDNRHPHPFVRSTLSMSVALWTSRTIKIRSEKNVASWKHQWWHVWVIVASFPVAVDVVYHIYWTMDRVRLNRTHNLSRKTKSLAFQQFLEKDTSCVLYKQLLLTLPFLSTSISFMHKNFLSILPFHLFQASIFSSYFILY